MKHRARRLLGWALLLPAVAAIWLAVFSQSHIMLPPDGIEFSLPAGSSLRTASRLLVRDGVLQEPYSFTWLGRILGKAGGIKAGKYLLQGEMTPLALLDKIARGDVSTETVTFVEGWNFGQLREKMNGHPGLKHDTREMTDSEILEALGIAAASPEGLFFPDTYHIDAGSSDLALLRRAYAVMQDELETAWRARAPGLPYRDPYEALILASIIEKETGTPSERPLIAAVFVNRLKIGMRLQTDPSVIYGIGSRFDGNLHRSDLLEDGPYNTYTRAGLPPTPIAMPGRGAIQAALNPEHSRALYFVAMGNGGHYFSNSLEEHNRAVARYQGGKR
jgi:peptidoglycan lytic transglycosylase G